MTVPKRVLVAVIFLLLLLLQLHAVYSLPFAWTVGVGIKDETGSDIVVSCKSKDNNLGTRTLGNGEIWKWKFKPNIGASTSYSCSFLWNTQGNTLTAGFVVFNVDVAPVYDWTINDWKVQIDGFYLYDYVKSAWFFRHKWGFHELVEPTDHEEVTRGLADGNDVGGV